MYPEQLAGLSAADPALGGRVAGLRNLEAILKWAPAAGVPLVGIDLLQAVSTRAIRVKTNQRSLAPSPSAAGPVAAP
jgi:hypothetical protein